MVLIPQDVGVRLRMQTETNLLQPATPARDLPAKLNDLRPGQNFTARIQEVLPDNTYRALVAGRQITLQLLQTVKANDVLDLVVVDRSGNTVVARHAEPQGAGAPQPYPFAKFSPAARLIAQLLAPEGQNAPPARLNGGQPLLAQPPQGQQAASLLAPALAKAVTHSGVFYEAHQARWVAGRLPFAQLLQEPQGQRSTAAAFERAGAEAGQRPAGAAPAGAEPKVGAGETAPRPGPAGNPAPSVPEGLRPLVQQQLDAVAGQRLVWHGEAWPRQTLEWEIEWDDGRHGEEAGEEASRWQTSLSLTTPRLGRIDAKLRLTPDGVQIALTTPEGASAADLAAAAPELAAALAAAGVPLRAFDVKRSTA